MKALLLVLAVATGMLLPLQAGINNPLKRALGSAFLPAFITFSVGALALLLFILLMRVPVPWRAAVGQIPWWNWVGGGLCGASFVTLVVALTPRLGVAVTFALVVGGEMLMSILLDRYGWLGFPLHAATPGRLAGAALLIGGVVLIQRF